MKKLLGIVVLGLLLSGNAYAEDNPYFLEGVTPRNLIKNGYELHSVLQKSGGSKSYLYTFTSNIGVVSCHVILEKKRGDEHRCYRITNKINE